ncbi:MAG: ECF transporter S component [Defluviitaleaceae bacterium]|nr:ECF transporter S component [Defluviitaleaceae bacterium]MCL2275569.1 ECF transporter S component [Defluviitaleaceae bacterium]
MYKNQWGHTKCIAMAGMLIAIIFLMTFTGIGIIPLPLLRPTTLHIPVIIGALLLGPKYGAVLGFAFGLASMLFATFLPAVTSFVFSPFINLPGMDNGSWIALVVAFIPRICIGITAWYAYVGASRLFHLQKKTVAWMVAGLVGALTNTVLVMHFIFFFFGETWNSVRATPSDVIYLGILSIISVNGIPEALVSALLVPAIMGALTVVINRMPSSNRAPSSKGAQQ